MTGKELSILIGITLVIVGGSSPDDIFLGEQHEPGFINLEKGGDLFYWFFPSRTDPEQDPLVFWLTGGPGCASAVALFAENGPFTIDKKSLKL